MQYLCQKCTVPAVAATPEQMCKNKTTELIIFMHGVLFELCVFFIFDKRNEIGLSFQRAFLIAMNHYRHIQTINAKNAKTVLKVNISAAL